MEANIKIDRICISCFCALRFVVITNRKLLENGYHFYCYCFIIADNKTFIEKAGGIEFTMNCINVHINNIFICICGATFLSLMLKESSKTMSLINSKACLNHT